MDDQLPWPEKHRPSTRTQLVGNEAVLRSLVDWLSTWNTSKLKKKAALLIGPPGTGVSANVSYPRIRVDSNKSLMQVIKGTRQ